MPGVIDSLYLDINGEVSITLAVLFNDQGLVDDWIPVRTNDVKMVQYIRQVIGDWKMYPPIDESDAPQWSYYEFEIKFENKSVILDLTVMESVMNFFNLAKDDIFLVVPYNALDSAPKLIVSATPELPKELLQTSAGKTLEIQFFIDKDGNVRLPVVKQSDVEPISKGILLDTLKSWKFETPMRNGKPVATRAIVPFQMKN